MTGSPDNSTNYPRIRPVEASHICDLIRIGVETNLSTWTAQNYLDELQVPESIMLRLESADNDTLGFVVGRIVHGGAGAAEMDAEIYNIAVIESEQGKSLGQVIFDAFLEKCRKLGAENIWLEVRASNQTAIRFYERNGFNLVQSRNNFYENPREHALLMKLPVQKPAPLMQKPAR